MSLYFAPVAQFKKRKGEIKHIDDPPLKSSHLVEAGCNYCDLRCVSCIHLHDLNDKFPFLEPVVGSWASRTRNARDKSNKCIAWAYDTIITSNERISGSSPRQIGSPLQFFNQLLPVLTFLPPWSFANVSRIIFRSAVWSINLFQDALLVNLLSRPVHSFL